MSSEATAPRPTAETERLDILDALRGFALGGILLLNLASFTGFVFMTPEMMAASRTAALDLPVAGLTIWLGYGKFYSLFSLLFGLGFSLQLAAAERRGDSRLILFKRRLLVLLLIGAVHLYFWQGDILVLYALVGFCLIPFRHASQATLIKTAIALEFAPVLVKTLIVVSGGWLDPGAPLLSLGYKVLEATGFSTDAAPYPTLRDAGWSEYLRFQLSGVLFRYADLITTGRPFKVLAMFLVGLWVGRSGMLTDMTPWIPTLRTVRRWGFALGLPAAAAQAAFMLGGTGDNPWMTDPRDARLRPRRRTAGHRLRHDVRDRVAIAGVARSAGTTRPSWPHGADELPHPHRRRYIRLLRSRPRAHGQGRPGMVAADRGRDDRGADGILPVVAGALCIRPD